MHNNNINNNNYYYYYYYYYIIIIIYLLYHSLCWCLFVHQPGAYHVPGASDTQIIHSDHTFSTFLRIRADPSMLIFWVSVTLALSDTLLMFSTIPLFIVPSAPTTTGITSVFICHILCISYSRSLYLLCFSISFRAIFLSDGIDISYYYYYYCYYHYYYYYYYYYECV